MTKDTPNVSFLRRLSGFDRIVIGVALLLIIIVAVVTQIGIATQPPLRVAYLVAGGADVVNVWIAEPGNPDSARQVTFSEIGVDGYSVSPDGAYIVYADRDFPTGATELRRVNIRSGEITTLTDCIQTRSRCTSPTYSPDGTQIAYQRSTVGRSDQNAEIPYRVWLLDMTTPAYETFPVIPDADILGVNPAWSADGSTLAFYDRGNSGVMVYDFEAAQSAQSPVTFVPTISGATGALSPDGGQLIFTDLILESIAVRSYLQLANLDALTFDVLTAPGENADDRAAAWNPDGRSVAISRRFIEDEAFTQGQQIYRLDMVDGSFDPLVVDADYNHGVFRWNSDGTALVLQRFESAALGQSAANIQPEIIIYDLETRSFTPVTDNGFQPQWVP